MVLPAPLQMKALTIAILCLASVVLADDFKTINGKEYKNAKVSRVEPDGIVLTFSGGIVKLPFTELPADVQKKYGYDTSAARIYTAEENQKQAALAQQRQAEVQNRAEETAKYWREHPMPQLRQQESTSSQLRGGALDGPANGQSSGVGSISPQFLVSEYSRSEINADALYKGRRFGMSGTIKSIFKSGDKAVVEVFVLGIQLGK